MCACFKEDISSLMSNIHHIYLDMCVQFFTKEFRMDGWKEEGNELCS